MRIEHLALSHLTCRIGGCLVPLELKGPEPQEETSNAHKLARLSTRYFWQLRCPYKHEKPLKHAGWLDNTIGGRGSRMAKDLDQGEFAMTNRTKDWAEKRADLSDVALAHSVLSVGRDSEVRAF